MFDHNVLCSSFELCGRTSAITHTHGHGHTYIPTKPHMQNNRITLGEHEVKFDNFTIL